MIQNSRSSFELQQAKDLKTIAIDQAKANLASTTANTGVLLARNEREAALNSQTLDKGVQEILNLKKQRGYTDVQMEEANKRIELLKKDGVLKDWEIALSKLGLTKTDPVYMRLTQEVVNKALNATKEGWKDFQEMPWTQKILQFLPPEFKGIFSELMKKY